MRVLKRATLQAFYEKHPNAKSPLLAWYEAAKKADWHNFAAVKKTFNSVDYVGNQRYVFNIKGNDYRLVVVIQYNHSTVYIRFVGTHAEYDKIDCTTI
ncbi:MAG: type II toxin-antitoxin system HigB family toxin [Candidatus Amulumruptor caecigallinarius]|nr:type II toxin-antitoxin system HigB family toxin [Candidatus Amulumruptor caecigallinarius]MCM1395957.1 type II toxin-antitoxin system HigB family toxin [Candidatus Amulumruptor caecigallinarius]MCM1452992.1 type II toxin-antitoxin system HigB family toxin [bacterium]